MVIGSDKNITTANVIQLHNNIPKILSKINIENKVKYKSVSRHDYYLIT